MFPHFVIVALQLWATCLPIECEEATCKPFSRHCKSGKRFTWSDREHVQGLCRAHQDDFPTELSLLQLWIHETDRVFADRLLVDDITKFENIRNVIGAKTFGSKMQASCHKTSILLLPTALNFNDGSAVNAKHNEA